MILHKGNQKVIKSNQREKLKNNEFTLVMAFFEGVRFPYGLLFTLLNILNFFWEKGREAFLFLPYSDSYAYPAWTQM